VNRFAARPRATIADVARVARVSKTTVSHVVSGNRPVASGTRERVESAISQLGYRPDGLARSLRTKQSHMIALIVPDIANPFYPALARGLEAGIDGRKYHTLICSTDGVGQQEIDFLEEVCDRRVDGIAIDSFSLGYAGLASVVGGSIPTVWIGATEDAHEGIDTVRSDDVRGAYEATMHLIGRGHERVGMIQGPPGAGNARNAGYRLALEEAGIVADPSLRLSGNWTREGGAAAMRTLLESSAPPTAVFCGNDMMAIGALDVTRRLNLSVPGDVALVGYDDIDIASLVHPALTTVQNPAFETGRTAGALLRDRLSGVYSGDARTVVLSCELLVRDSS
jgi:LacI family transcriptional regulator